MQGRDGRQPMKIDDVLRRSIATFHRYSPQLVKINTWITWQIPGLQ